MKVPRRQMMNARVEFLLTKQKGQSRVGKYLIVSTLPSDELKESKFAFVTSKKVGNAVARNLVRRRFRDLVSRHGDQIQGERYLVMIGRYSAPKVDFKILEAEFLKICRKLQVLPKEAE